MQVNYLYICIYSREEASILSVKIVSSAFLLIVQRLNASN